MRVMFSTRPHAMTHNPYIKMLSDALSAEGIDISPWSWRDALAGNYDVLHIHWPEFIASHRRPAIRAAHFALTPALIASLTARKIPVVHTAHNRYLHRDMPFGAKRMISELEKTYRARIVMNHDELSDYGCAESGAPGDDGLHTWFIPHGHYRSWYDEPSSTDTVPGRFLFFGGIRKYKRLPRFLETFTSHENSDISLRVVGKLEDNDDTAHITQLISSDARVTSHLSYVDDDQVAKEFAQADVVVMPYAEQNSGVALLALSLNRPILMPDSPLGRSLRDEFGAAWVYLTDSNDVTGVDLDKAVQQSREKSTHTSPMAHRDWDAIARQHVDVYMASLSDKKG